eukprot:Skav218879  [mRNA]  locus=scaffold2503:118653:119834:+ [translate_table: standard]
MLGIGPTAVTYSETLRACKTEGGSRNWQQAWQLFDQVDEISQSIAISLAGQRDWTLALALAHSTAAQRLQVDTVVLNTALGICASQRWRSAMAIFRSVQSLALRSSAVTYSSATTAAARCHLWEVAFQLNWNLRGNTLEPSLVVQSAVTGATVIRWQKSFKVARDLQYRSVRANTILFGSVMAACNEGKQWSKGLHLLIHLGSSALLANTIAMNSLVSACSASAAAWQRALMLFKVAAHWHIEMDIISSGAQIAVAPRWSLALGFLETSEVASLRSEPEGPEGEIWGDDGRWLECCAMPSINPWTALQALRLSVEAMNAALSTFQSTHFWREATQATAMFGLKGLEPDSVSDGSIISSLFQFYSFFCWRFTDFIPAGLTPEVCIAGVCGTQSA